MSFRNNQNDFNYSPQEVGYGAGGYAGGAPVIAPTFISTPSGPAPYAFAPPIAPVAPVLPGGFGGLGFGGIGGGGLLEAIVLGSIFGNGFLGNRGRGQECCDNDNAGNLAILSAVAGAKETSVSEGRAILAGLANNKDVTVAEARAISNAICESEKTNLQQFYAAAIQAANNTQSIKDQSANETALILARLNQTEVDSLRDRLEVERRGRDSRDLEIKIENTNTAVAAQFQQQQQLQTQRELDDHRRRFDNREIEINNINTNTNVQAQLQQQQQQQILRDRERDFEFHRRFDVLFNQQNKVAQDIINIGAGTVAANQTSSPTNVNSKNVQ